MISSRRKYEEKNGNVLKQYQLSKVKRNLTINSCKWASEPTKNKITSLIFKTCISLTAIDLLSMKRPSSLIFKLARAIQN